MNLSCATTRSIYAVVILATALALPSPLSGQQSMAGSRGGIDPGLLRSNNGVMPLLSDRVHRADNGDLLRFDTNECGMLQRVERRHSMARQSALEGGLGFDQDDPSAKGRAMVGSWLSLHPEIAVIGNAVQKSCGVDGFDEDPPDVT